MSNPKLEKVDLELNNINKLKKSIHTFVKEGLDINNSTTKKALKNIEMNQENELKKSIKKMIVDETESQTNKLQQNYKFYYIYIKGIK